MGKRDDKPVQRPTPRKRKREEDSDEDDEFDEPRPSPTKDKGVAAFLASEESDDDLVKSSSDKVSDDGSDKSSASEPIVKAKAATNRGQPPHLIPNFWTPSSVPYKKRKLCGECGEDVTPTQELYKQTCVHYICGISARSANRYLKLKNPKLHKQLQRMKTKNPKSYHEIMKDICNKKKGAYLGQEKIDKMVKTLKKNAASRAIVCSDKEGLVFLDEDEYVYHWKTRKGWSEKKSRKEYKRELNLPDAVTKKHAKRGILLGVEKPPEMDKSDVIKMQQKIKGKIGGLLAQADLEQLAKGFGSAPAGLKRVKIAVDLKPVDAAGSDSEDGEEEGSEEEEDSEASDAAESGSEADASSAKCYKSEQEPRKRIPNKRSASKAEGACNKSSSSSGMFHRFSLDF